MHVDGGSGPNAAIRRDGYLAAMAAAGLADRTRVLPGAYDEEAGIAAARALLDGPDLPTAVVAANDRCATGLLDTPGGAPVVQVLALQLVVRRTTAPVITDREPGRPRTAGSLPDP